MPTLVTPINTRIRNLFLDTPCRTNRSVDSGYGSLETSPTRSKRSDRTSGSLAARLESLSVNSYDGNSSEESESGGPPGIDNSPCAGRDKSATLPRVSRRRISRTDSYPLLAARQGARQRYGSDNTGIHASTPNSVKQPDRFVPLRDHVVPGYEKLQTTKPLDALTPSERLVRHNRDAPDPFCFKRMPMPPPPTEARKARRLGNGTTLDTASHGRADRVVSRSAHPTERLCGLWQHDRLITHASR